MRNSRNRLTDIITAIEKIEQVAAEGRTRFEHDEMAQVWMVHHMQVVGEAVASLPLELRRRYRDVSWGRASAMRNRLAHGYFDVDLDIVWDVVENDLPLFKAAIERILSDTDEGEDIT